MSDNWEPKNIKKMKQNNYILKEFFRDFIVKENFVLDQKLIKCEGTSFNIHFEKEGAFDDNYTLNLGFCNIFLNEVKIIYEKILRLQNEVQEYKEDIIIKSCINNNVQINDKLVNNRLQSDKDSELKDIKKKIEDEKIFDKILEIKACYKKLEVVLNEKEDVVKYFYLPEKEKRLEIYKNLRKNPTLIYEILGEKTDFLNNQDISTVFSDFSDKILKITQTVNYLSQFHLTVKKINKTTSSVVGDLKNTFSNISFAGNKDKRGITFQRFSVKACLKDLLSYNNTPSAPLLLNSKEENDLLKLVNGKIKTPPFLFSQFISCQKNIGLGDLKGNDFEVTIREIQHLSSFIAKLTSLGNFIVPNYFGPQRFGNKANNHLIGKYLYEKSYAKAYELFSDSGNKELLNENQSKQFFNRKLRREQKTLFEHAYQSYLFNCWVDYLIKGDFDTKKDYTLNEEDYLYLREHKISLNECKEIIKENNLEELQNISFKLPFTGKNNIFRKVFFTPKYFTFKKIEGTCVLSFSLDSSSYATTLIDWLFSFNSS